MNCPFCNINSERTKIIKDYERVFVVLSNPRLMPGHLLVIPKRHLEKVSQLNKEEKIEVFDTIIEFQEKILAKFAKGCDIKSNYRPFIPQGRTKVNHLHFHLQPREFEDELYQKSQKFDKELWKDLAEEEIIKLTKLLS